MSGLWDYFSEVEGTRLRDFQGFLPDWPSVTLQLETFSDLVLKVHVLPEDRPYLGVGLLLFNVVERFLNEFRDRLIINYGVDLLGDPVDPFEFFLKIPILRELCLRSFQVAAPHGYDALP